MKPLKLVLDGIWLRVGRCDKPITYTVGTDVIPENGVNVNSFALVLFWPKKYRFLTVSCSHRQPGGPNEPFLKGQDEIYRMLAEFHRESTIPERTRETNHLAVARVGKGSEITLEFSLDSDDRTFDDLIGGLGPGDAVVSLNLVVFDEKRVDQGKLELRLESELGQRPADAPGYRGYVAIDLGNTATCVACLPEGLSRESEIELLAVEPSRPPEEVPRTVPSILRIEEIDSTADEDRFEHHHPDWAKWVIGSASAAGGASDGLVLGAKRLATSRDADKKKINVFAWNERQHTPGPRQPIPIPRSIPAELLVCRIFQRFKEVNHTTPDRLAITYPSTLSKDELDNLSRTIYRGWLRMQVQPQTPQALEQQGQRLLLQLDEAAAAGFFFLYRRIFQGSAGLPGFRYLYPRGLNLLLYDCGGGTTDIALVTARPDEVDPQRLAVVVRARSGLREFGGDNITTEIFRLLKARIALKMVHELRHPVSGQALPANLTDLAVDLEKYSAGFEALVPTMFRPEVMDAQANRNRQHTLELWDLAEKVKQLLQTQNEASPIFTAESKLFQFLLQRQPDRKNQLLNALGQVKVQRREVDALIRDLLMRSIENCNGLIQEKLTPHGEEVHCVAVAGNATRYPLVRELLQEKLDVPFCEDRLEWDQDNLKFAVAKGAVLALSVIQSNRGLIDFPSDLSNRLPFDVAYRDLDVDDYYRLFFEHQRYDELSPNTIKIRPAKDEREGAHVVTLYRHWPGDMDPKRRPRYTPFLTWTFPEPIQGPVTVAYDLTRTPAGFTARYGKIEGVLEEPQEETYRSPVQRGNL
jgi:molecular chaperone DnaK (HSP70)